MSEYIFKLPDLGEGMVEAEIAEWMVKVGDTLNEEDVFAGIMTDKAVVELSAPVAGRVLSLAGEPGDIIAVGSPLIVFETADEQPPPDQEAAGPMATPQSAKNPVANSQRTTAAGETGAEPTRTGKILTSPSVRHVAREAGVDLANVTGSGPRGRILRSDLNSYLASHATATEPGKPSAPSAPVTEVKVIGLRRIIAERMSQANREIPHFSYVEEVDVTALEVLRQHLNNTRAADTGKLTLLAFIGFALARVLAHFPQCNALYDKQRNVIIQYQGVHLGIATQTPDGLKVPVVRHAEGLSLNDLASEIRHLSAAARDNTAKRQELMGSTITITSLGKQGGIVTTPVINLPEVAIIGVNKAVERPVVVAGQLVIRRMMNLSSSFDHRFVDGYDAAMMIQALKEKLEQPTTTFMQD